jgi:hypothetical protein
MLASYSKHITLAVNKKVSAKACKKALGAKTRSKSQREKRNPAIGQPSD